MSASFVDNPVLNSPFRRPERHFELDEEGNPTGVKNQGRRRSVYLVPIPPPKKRKGPKQEELAFRVGGDERVTENPLVNKVRNEVDKWRPVPNRCGGCDYLGRCTAGQAAGGSVR